MAVRPKLLFFKTQLFKKRATTLDAWDEVDKLKELLHSDPAIGKVIHRVTG
jgi:hypothetical protein